MTYEQALEYIHSRPRVKKTDFHRGMRRLLEYLGNPQDNLKYVHIAGTNGKGSCAAMSANVLHTAGYKVGLNISPFVIDFTERISINGEYIPRQTLADITEKVKYYRDKITAEEGLQILEFETVTAIAFYYFNMEKCDVVCLEVGIGGLLDSTNVIKDCLVSCIMNISYDHTRILGDTLAQIARQKAGIIKKGRPVICYPALEKEALDVVVQKARENSAPLIIPDISRIKSSHTGFMQSQLEYKGIKINQAFTGIHQSYNASVVIEAMRRLRDYGFEISDEDIAKGIESTSFPARIEVLSKNPLVIIDGGHNTDGISALIKVLQENSLYGLTAVWASLSDKQPMDIISMISPYIDRLYTVNLHGSRAIDSRQLAEMASKNIKCVKAFDLVTSAIDEGLSHRENGLLVFGSLYLASDARAYLVEKLRDNK